MVLYQHLVSSGQPKLSKQIFPKNILSCSGWILFWNWILDCPPSWTRWMHTFLTQGGGLMRMVILKILEELLYTSWKRLWYITFIPAWPVSFIQQNQILWIYWFLRGYLHQYFGKLCSRNLNNILKTKNTLIWIRKNVFFIIASLGPLSGYHNLI